MNFNAPLPVNEAYANEHSRLVLGDELGKGGENTLDYLLQRVAELGLPATVDLFMEGQYQYPDGFGYGGNTPTWSNQTLRDILTNEARGVAKVCFVEYHTGLGPWAYGTLVTMHTGSDLERVRRHFGPWTVSPAEPKPGEEDAFYKVTGHTIACYQDSFPEAEVTAVTLEFGSYPSDETLALMLQEHLLLQSSDALETSLEQVRERMREYHHPSEWEWRCAHWSRSQQVIRQAISVLATD